MRRRAIWFSLAIGIGLIAAPAVFQMFTRAPLGATMIEEFRPFMKASTIDNFSGHLDTIDEAAGELGNQTAAGNFRSEYSSAASFLGAWPGIEADMRGMLDVMRSNLDNYAAVDALPPFYLFPWFFVIPGLAVAGLAVASIRRRERWIRVAIAVAGIGLIAAPGIFQMFSRAPLGGKMIEDFRPLMTPAKVTQVQLYFLTIGAAEGEIRNKLMPDIQAASQYNDEGFRKAFPALSTLSDSFPKISGDMAPMIGAMSDNLDNYAAVDALPPFAVFPWFFVVPGVLLVAAGSLSSLRNIDRSASKASLVAALLILGACGSGTPDTTSQKAATNLTGLFAVDGGECAAAGITKGSYFRMVNPGGDPSTGPFVTNADSSCIDKTWTLLLPGTDGGLRTGEFQPNPDPAFDSAGHALAGKITAPTRWFAVSFALSTNKVDPQTGTEVAAPRIEAKGNTLSGDVRGFAAAWNKQHFNQGSQKPDGSRPGATTGPSGTYDATTGRYALEWTSQIVGGAFNNFIGVWHLEGKFTPN